MSAAGDDHRRPMRLICIVLTIATVLLVAGYLVLARRLPPAPALSRTLPQPNGFDAFSRAFRSSVIGGETGAVARDQSATTAALRRELGTAREALAELRQATRYEWGVTAQRGASPGGYSRWMADAARLFVADSRLAAREGRNAAAVDAALDTVELGARIASASGGPEMLGAAVAVCGIGGRQVSNLLDGLSAAEAEQAGARLEQIAARLPSTAAELASQSEIASWYVHETLTDRGADALLYELAYPMGTARAFFYPASWSHRHYAAYWRGLAEAAKAPFPSRPPPGDGRWLLQPLFPSFASGAAPQAAVVEVLPDLNRARLRLLRCELALAAHRQRTGAYPAALADLAGVSEAARIDPFAAAPFRYSREGPRYLLYSIGPDGVDGGGSPVLAGGNSRADAGDIVAGKLWPPAAR